MNTRFLDLGYSPLADQFHADPVSSVDSETYPLALTVDYETWAVELTHQVPDELLFGKDYAFFTGSSPSLIGYFGNYADWVKRSFPDQVKRGVLEIACNDGTLLRNFRSYGHVYGVDPAGPPTEKAREDGLDVRTVPFTADVARDLSEMWSVDGGVVVANNVAAHVSDLDDFLQGIHTLIGTEGVGILEFQYLPDLLDSNGFDLVYHEHLRFLSLSNIIGPLARAGLVPVDCLRTDAQGGSLRLVVTRDTRDRYWADVSDGVSNLHYQESWTRNPEVYESFQGRVDRVLGRLGDVLDRYDRVALYGAPAKATTLLHALAAVSGDIPDIQYAVDLTPDKRGRYMPGTAIPVISPSDEGDYAPRDAYLLASHNYAGPILRREFNDEFRAPDFIVPLPYPKVF